MRQSTVHEFKKLTFRVSYWKQIYWPLWDTAGISLEKSHVGRNCQIRCKGKCRRIHGTIIRILSRYRYAKFLCFVKQQNMNSCLERSINTRVRFL
jgi:hypothetical protein